MTPDTAIVLGVGPGLGRALVRRFAAEGMLVYAGARGATTRDFLAEDARAHDDWIVPVDCDATDAANVDALVAKAAARGPVRLAVYNAGKLVTGGSEARPADLEAAWKVNGLGGFHLGRAAGAAMRHQKQKGGTLLFTGATASVRGGSGFLPFAAAKFALRGVAQSLARELGPEGIHVAHVLLDGMIHTEARAAERDPESLLDPEAIADAYWKLHQQPKTAWTHELDLRPWTETF